MHSKPSTLIHGHFHATLAYAQAGARIIGMRTIGMQTTGMRIIGMEDNWHAENWHGGQLALILLSYDVSYLITLFIWFHT